MPSSIPVTAPRPLPDILDIPVEDNAEIRVCYTTPIPSSTLYTASIDKHSSTVSAPNPVGVDVLMPEYPKIHRALPDPTIGGLQSTRNSVRVDALTSPNPWVCPSALNPASVRPAAAQNPTGLNVIKPNTSGGLNLQAMVRSWPRRLRDQLTRLLRDSARLAYIAAGQWPHSRLGFGVKANGLRDRTNSPIIS